MTSAALWRITRPSHAGMPLLVNVPHAGIFLPPAIAATLTPAALTLPDTDWFVDQLAGFVPAVGATLMVATHSRIVVDLNRDPSGVALYPGASNSEICATETFADEPIYLQGCAPDAASVNARIDAYWQPYHRQLAVEIARLKAAHGHCLLLDLHSIKRVVPRFFAGILPDLNFGTVDGQSSAAELAQAAFQVLANANGFTAVHNGRFKGGYITRHYGAPLTGVHAMQLEIAQGCYMDENSPVKFDARRAAALIDVLKNLLAEILKTPAPFGREQKTGIA